MSEKYSWMNDEIPLIEPHSIVKHEVIKKYINQYINTICKNPRVQQMKLVVVDGFCGGGIYKDQNNKEVLGSPFVIITAIEEALQQINEKRQVPLELLLTFYFIDKSKAAIACLKKQTRERYSDLYPHINFVADKFINVYKKVIHDIKNERPKTKRALFVLDQYGYSDVPMEVLQGIFAGLELPEVILTYSMGAMLVYLNESDQMLATLRKLGLYDELAPHLSMIKEYKDGNSYFRFFETRVSTAIQEKCGATYVTPFFIAKETKNRLHKDRYYYWILHFSKKRIANEVMKDVHWDFANESSHFDSVGIYGIGYNGNRDLNLRGQKDLFVADQVGFTPEIRQSSIAETTGQLEEIFYNERMRYNHTDFTVEDVYNRLANHSIASREMINICLENLIKRKIIIIRDGNGKERRRYTTIHKNDIISVINNQNIFLMPNITF